VSTKFTNQPSAGHPPKNNELSVEIVGEQQLLFIEFSEGELSAKVTILPPATADDTFVTLNDLNNAIAKYNVVYGVDHRVLAEVSAKIVQYAAAKNLTEMIDADFAFGLPPVPSQDAKIECFYKNEKDPDSSFEEGPPQDEFGRVDHRAGRKIDNVIRGSLLVRRTPPTPGTPGKSVTGRDILPAPGKDINLILGKDVVVHPEKPNEFYADADGHVVIKDGRISIQPVYEIHGDLDLSIGNIMFYGTVIVYGDVKDGFKIHAGEDLIIRGVLEGAEVKAEGNLTVLGGVTGNDKAHIVCKGDALLKYIQNATVEVGGNLNVIQSITHSKVSCDHTVTVSGQKGLIIGGQVVARRAVTAAVFGSSFGTLTELIVGEQIDLREQILNVEDRLKAIDLQLDKTRKALAYLKEMYARLGGNLPEDKKKIYTSLSRSFIKYTSESKILSEKRRELEIKQKEFMEEKPIPRVNCSYMIYPGVRVTINRAYIAFSEEQKLCSLTEFEGQIRVGAFRVKY